MPEQGLAQATQQHIWNDLVGPAWVRHAAIHDRQAEPFGIAAMDALGSVAGATVLDVGCGTGAATQELARRGAREVHGVDISAPMIDAARASVSTSAVRYTLGDALDLDGEERFDVVYSRFGVMFFDDPVSAFRRLRSLGTDGARLAFCCWGPPTENPWMAVPVMATVPVLGPPQLAGPGAPGPFGLSSGDVVRSILDDAGWSDVTIQPITMEQPHPAGDAASAADMIAEFSPPIAEGLRRAPERADDARFAIAEALRPLERDGIVHLRFSALIVSASSA
jgi:SAM-dependent methyltransferase